MLDHPSVPELPDRHVDDAGETNHASAVRSDRFLTDHHGLLSLLEASQLVTEDLDLDQVLRHLAESARTLVDARFAALGVVDDEGALERFIHVGMSPELVEQMGAPPRGLGVLGAVLTGSEPIRIRNLSDDPRSVGLPLAHPEMQAFLGVPIMIRGGTYGALYLTNSSEKSFTANDEALVQALAATAATAINNARLYERTRRAQELSAALGDVAARLLNAEGDEVFGVLAESVVSLTGAQLVSVVVSEAVGQALFVDTARGARAARLEGASVPWMDCVLSRAMNGEPGITPLEADEPVPFAEDIPSASMIAVPLVVAGDRVAALCATRSATEPRFSADDLELLTEFATQAGLAVALAWARVDREHLEMVEERSRIARDLHDNVIQRLFGAGMGLQALASAHPQQAARLEPHVAQIDAAIADIRTAIFALQTQAPQMNVRHQLLEVVSELSPTLSTVPRLTFTGPVDLILEGSLADDAVAVLRESLSNVARHAHAETVWVEVSATETDITITIDDDGVGISPNSVLNSGTKNLRARAHAHGGDFQLCPRSSGGTRSRWHAPVNSPRLT
ncbi:histidine kinase [Nesterenkonia sp. AN1]|uniref:Histidine kinase/DNA gyrase B/HSP90-like ATPase n=1 Tax=Nesterenkonia aurantiaca TaxID=1436010 RepID=A0A4R7G624_9MICC|nr:GAF domain-containing protein [Nesterenkonia aurantiaca]EXF23994.1 histidine kinase [Nesterenkonia sp. AN1]TDS86924.1 histidine kinase/DNA gyrase B/HSP90-like ATPase [Nesterenkonia aurantiaca]